jgi:hypothetical protein
MAENPARVTSALPFPERKIRRESEALGEHIALRLREMSATWVRRDVFPHFDDHAALARAVAIRAVAYFRLELCRARRHHMVMRFEPDRLWLHCDTCGADSPGWSIDVDRRFTSHR